MVHVPKCSCLLRCCVCRRVRHDGWQTIAHCFDHGWKWLERHAKLPYVIAFAVVEFLVAAISAIGFVRYPALDAVAVHSAINHVVFGFASFLMGIHALHGLVSSMLRKVKMVRWYWRAMPFTAGHCFIMLLSLTNLSCRCEFPDSDYSQCLALANFSSFTNPFPKELKPPPQIENALDTMALQEIDRLDVADGLPDVVVEEGRLLAGDHHRGNHGATKLEFAGLPKKHIEKLVHETCMCERADDWDSDILSNAYMQSCNMYKDAHGSMRGWCYVNEKSVEQCKKDFPDKMHSAHGKYWTQELCKAPCECSNNEMQGLYNDPSRNDDVVGQVNHQLQACYDWFNTGKPFCLVGVDTVCANRDPRPMKYLPGDWSWAQASMNEVFQFSSSYPCEVNGAMLIARHLCLFFRLGMTAALILYVVGFVFFFGVVYFFLRLGCSDFTEAEEQFTVTFSSSDEDEDDFDIEDDEARRSRRSMSMGRKKSGRSFNKAAQGAARQAKAPPAEVEMSQQGSERRVRFDDRVQAQSVESVEGARAGASSGGRDTANAPSQSGEWSWWPASWGDRPS